MEAITCILLAFLFSNTSFGSAEGMYPCEEDLIEIMFDGDAVVRLREGELLDLTGSGALEGIDEILSSLQTCQWMRVVDLPESELDAMEAEGEALSGEEVYNLNNIYRLRFAGEVDVWELSEKLEALPGIVRAMPVPLPQPVPIPPDYQSYQGYLNAASMTPTGINAIYAWSQGGGSGTGVTVCDLEYSWNYNHNDILKASGSQINTGVVDPFGDDNHGTAVLGEMVSDYNGWGTTGICHGASLKTCGTYYGSPSPVWNVSGAIGVAISNLNPGDVIIIEQQWEYVSGSSDYVPIEWWGDTYPSSQSYNSVYVAIQNAVLNGIHVVEAGGNAVNSGGADMDLMSWFGDSGAIIVGAGGAYPGGTWPNGDLQRLYFSNYGARFTSQGWGEDVVTTGYGTLYNSEGVDYYYASGFSGTSSASPIVAGAAACCVGYWMANGNPASTLTPAMLRNVLANTGTPQVTPPTGNIGTRPDLAGAFGMLYSMGIGVSTESGAFTGALHVYPNPVSGSASMKAVMPDNATVLNVMIYDTNGRMIRELQACADNQFSWDCTDNGGIRVPDGIYVAAIPGSEEMVARVVTVLSN
jgi:serine protease